MVQTIPTYSVLKPFLSGQGPCYLQYFFWLKMKKAAAAAPGASVVFHNHLLGFVLGINISIMTMLGGELPALNLLEHAAA